MAVLIYGTWILAAFFALVVVVVWLKHFWHERTNRDSQILESWAEICHSPTSLKNIGKELTELKQELAALRKKLDE